MTDNNPGLNKYRQARAAGKAQAIRRKADIARLVTEFGRKYAVQETELLTLLNKHAALFGTKITKKEIEEPLAMLLVQLEQERQLKEQAERKLENDIATVAGDSMVR